MCRIFGISYGSEREEFDAAEIAAILYPALVHQGPHAWGWMTYSAEDEQITSMRYPGRADTDDAWNRQMDDIDPDAKWLVGHVRWATHGDPKDNRNNHPIEHGNIIGVHNGVLSNHEAILKVTGRQDPKTKVDSEAIFAAVNRWGPSEGLRRIEGSAAVVYANKERPHVLHLARTVGRQITLGWTEKGNLIFASEQQALLQLEPEIRFRKFSTISGYRLLLVRNGKIIQRHTFYEAPPRPPVNFKNAPATVVGARPSIDPSYWGWNNQGRANKRGEMMFSETGRKAGKGKKTPRKPYRDTVQIPTGIIDADGSEYPAGDTNDLYYFEGQLLTRAEYEEAIASQ